MTQLREIQTSFSAGELSPAMGARVDLQKYASGCKTLRNFFVYAHGGAGNRAGTEFINATKYPDKFSRVVRFKFSTLQAYTLEFGDKYIRFYKDGGLIVYPVGHAQAGQPVEVVTPYTEADVVTLKFTQSADVIFLVHTNHPPQQLTRSSHTSWTLTAFPYKDGPFADMNIDTDNKITPNGVSGNITLTAAKDTFLAGHVGALWLLCHFVEGQSVSLAITTNVSTATVKCKGTWKLITHGTWTGKLKVERSLDNGVTWQAIRFYSASGDFNASDNGNEDELCLIRVTGYSWSSGTCNVDLSSWPYKRRGVCRITAVTNAKTATATVTTELGGTAATDEWAEGAWSITCGNPATVAFYNQRLTFGNSQKQPQTFWMSKPDDFVNFATEVPPIDDDAINRTLASQEVNEIRAMVGLSQLIVLTSAAEWKIGPASTGSAITPNGLRANTEGYRGASMVDPVIIGNRIIFVQDKGSTVRDLGYSLESDGFTGQDISILSKHLVKDNVIVDMAYQQEPESIAWMVRDDGQLLGLTYMKEQEVVAWHRHDTDGKFESVTTIPGEDRDEVWFTVARQVGGKTARYVERMANRLPRDKDIKKAWFLDCALRYEGTATKTVSGLGHLEGRTVSALADGNVIDGLVVTGGKVTLSTGAETYSVVLVGLPYMSELQTLNVDINTTEGTVQGQPKRIPEVTLRLEDSRGGWIGPDADNMDELNTLIRAQWDDPLPLFSGDVKMNIPNGFNTEGVIMVRQTDPLPLTILAVIPKVVLAS